MGNADDEDDSGGGRTQRRRTAPEGVATGEARLRALEFQLAEKFGVDGDGGQFRALEKRVRDHEREWREEGETMKAQIKELDTFRIRALTTIALATTVGSLLTGIIAVVVEHYLK